MIRYIVFDTETTGLNPLNGDKIIEIGAVELINKERSGKTYHQLINPEKNISKETTEITHINNETVANMPKFKDIANDFLSFLKKEPDDCQQTFLVAHNASFDIKFLNHELKQAGFNGLPPFEVIDTLDIARQKFPNQKATLDILCEKFNISLEKRKKEGHGALLDSQILVDVFLKLTEGAPEILKEDDNIDFVGFEKQKIKLKNRYFTISEEDLSQHIKFLQENDINNF